MDPLDKAATTIQRSYRAFRSNRQPKPFAGRNLTFQQRVESLRDKRRAEVERIRIRTKIKAKLDRKYSNRIAKLHMQWVKQQKQAYASQRKERQLILHREIQHKLHQPNTKIMYSSIREAAQSGDAERIEELVRLGNNVNAESAMGLTPLMAACRTGNYDSVKVLLKHGADVNHQHVVTQRTALMQACSGTNAAIVRELLRYGAVLDLRDIEEKTAQDYIRESAIERIFDFATRTWSAENSFVFPMKHRAAGLTLALCHLRLRKEHQRRVKEAKAQSREKLAEMKLRLASARVKYESA